jgi:hypothetical protein
MKEDLKITHQSYDALYKEFDKLRSKGVSDDRLASEKAAMAEEFDRERRRFMRDKQKLERDLDGFKVMRMLLNEILHDILRTRYYSYLDIDD